MKIAMNASTSVRQNLYKMYWSTKYYGLPLTLCGVALKIIPTSAGTSWHKAAVSRSFDRRFQVDTSGYVAVEDLDIPDDAREGALHYQPTAAVTFGAVLSRLGIKYRDFTFVDFGSGKGRTLVQAAHFPFKEIVGVEISRGLHEAAVRNVSSLSLAGRKCGPIRCVCEDATRFALPPEPLVLYFFHPFDENVLQPVLDNMERSHKRLRRPIVVVYQAPIFPPERQIKRLTEAFEKARFLRRSYQAYDDPNWEVYEAV
jgi:hypothetical protein